MVPFPHMCWVAGAVPLPCDCIIGENHTDDDARRLIAAIEGEPVESVPALSGEEPEE